MVMRSIGERGKIVKRGDVRMLHFRCYARFAQKAIVRVFTAGVLRANHFDDARGAEVDVLDFVDLAHAAGAEALEDAVLAVDGRVGVGAKKIGDRFTAMRTRAKVGIDFSEASETLHRGMIVLSDES